MARPQINDDEVDLTGQSSGFDALPAGKYETTFFKSEVGTIESGDHQGKKKLNLQFKLNPDAHPDYKGRIIFDGIPIIPDSKLPDGETKKGTLWRLDQLLTALGIPPQNRQKVNLSQVSDFLGMPVRLELTQYEYPEGSGTKRNRVKKFLVATGLAPSPVSGGRSTDVFR